MTRVARALRAPGPGGVAGAILALAFVATFLVHPWSDESVGDLGVRSGFASLMLEGALPYRDFPFEYPPLAAPAVALPGLAGTEDGAYRVGIAALAFAGTAAVVLLAGALARRTGGRPAVAMIALALTPLLLGAVVRLHIDALPVALTLGALVAVAAHRPALGLALLGAGAMTKGFPLVAAPVILAWLWGRGGRRAALRGLVALVATIAVVGAGWAALSFDGAQDSLAYQLDRPVQVESAPASVLFLAGWLGGDAPAVIQSHRAAALLHPADGAVGVTFAVALVATVALLSAWVVVAARRTPPPLGPRALVLATLVAVAAFAAFGRVLSPQYLVWVAPLLALAAAWRMWGLTAVSVLASALTLVEFPFRYPDLLEAEPVAVGITAARNAALVAIVVIAGAEVRQLARAPARARAATPVGEAPVQSIVPAHPAARR